MLRRRTHAETRKVCEGLPRAFPGLKSETLRLRSGQALGHPACGQWRVVVSQVSKSRPFVKLRAGSGAPIFVLGLGDGIWVIRRLADGAENEGLGIAECAKSNCRSYVGRRGDLLRMTSVWLIFIPFGGPKAHQPQGRLWGAGMWSVEGRTFPGLKSETSAPRTKTCSWGPRTWGSRLRRAASTCTRCLRRPASPNRWLDR